MNTNCIKRWQNFPTGPRCARTTHSMTFALRYQLIFNWLMIWVSKISHILMRESNSLELTFLPALLLCKFINDRESLFVSLESKKCFANFIPYLILVLQPDHFHELSFGWLALPSWLHPQKVMFPRLHAWLIAYVTPAELIA
jgi:hypothetical protein